MAFLVFALIVSVVLGIVSRGLIGAEHMARYQHAVLLAESLLDRAMADPPAPGSSFDGTEPGDLRWTLHIQAVPGVDGPRMRLLRAEAIVEFDTERRVTLQTLIPART